MNWSYFVAYPGTLKSTSYDMHWLVFEIRGGGSTPETGAHPMPVRGMAWLVLRAGPVAMSGSWPEERRASRRER